ncbi:MAG: hypothetical protein QM778_11255 [Myxococcales bacterium]
MSREPASGPSARPPRPPRATPRPGTNAAERAKPDLRQRYYQALLREPGDTFALERLRELSLASEGSLEPLAQRLEQTIHERPGETAAAEVLARLWLAEGQLARAQGVLVNALEDYPERAPLHMLRAELHRRAHEPELARAEYESVRRLAPRGPLQLLSLQGEAELALDEGELARAADLFSQLERADPMRAGSAAAFARALSAHGFHREAAVQYAQAAERMRGDVRARTPLLREAARVQLAAGDASGALATLDRAWGTAAASERAELRDLQVAAYRRLERLPELAERFEREGALDQAGALWEELGDDARALTALRAQVKRAPQDIDSLERLAHVLGRGGQLDELTKVYRDLVRAAPLEPRYATTLAQLLRDSGKPEEAFGLLESVSKRARASAVVHRALAELYGRWGENERAARELSLLAQLEPDDPAHVVALGEEALARGDRAAASAIWQRLPRLAGAEGEGQLLLAQTLADHDLVDEALVAVQRARELLPGRFDVLRLEASLFERTGHAIEAERVWLEGLRLQELEPEARREVHQHLVALWRRQGLSTRKLRELEQRVRRNPQDVEALWLMAELYARDPSQSGKEVPTLERLLQLRSGDVETLRALERAHARRGESARVLEVLDRLIVAEPTQAAAHLARAVRLALESYQDDAALAYATRALALKPNDASTQKLVGDLYRRRQNLEAAIAAYQRAAELERQDFDTRLLLAQLETARGRVPEAFGWWLAIVQGAQDDALIGRAVRAARELPLVESQRAELERVLLEQSLAHAQRTIYRRLLVEAYAQWFEPLCARFEAGRLDAVESASFAGLARRALKPLIEALSDADGFQRATALGLLAALGARGAGPALLNLAEHGSVAAERAQALVALGRAADPALIPRLKTLLRETERGLKPFVLWALAMSEGNQATETLRSALHMSDVSLRLIGILGLGTLRAQTARTELQQLASDRHPVLRAAAHWAWSEVEAQQTLRAELLDELHGEGPAGLVALLTLRDDPEAISRGLLAPAVALRSAAAHLALQSIAPRTASTSQPKDGPAGNAVASFALTLPPPAWPFAVRHYFASWIARQTTEREDAPAEVHASLGWLWPQLGAVAQELLSNDRSNAEAVLSALSPVTGGLAPAALLEVMPCFSTELAQALAVQLAPALIALVEANPDPSLRTAALVRLSLASSERALQPLEAVLADPSDPAFRPLLQAIFRERGRPETPATLAPARLRSQLGLVGPARHCTAARPRCRRRAPAERTSGPGESPRRQFPGGPQQSLSPAQPAN